MKRGIMVIALLAITAPLWASVEKTVSWTPPTERMNGDALPAGEIASYDLVCQEAGSGTAVYTTNVPGGQSSHETGAVFEAGEYLCRMRTVDTEGRISPDWAESQVFSVGRCDVSDCSPRAPASITVNLP